MDYAEVKFSLEPYSQHESEILAAMLAQVGFDSFTDNPDGINAYIPAKQFANLNLEEYLCELPVLKARISFSAVIIKDQNWNKQWESNFEPISVEDFCRVRAPFHKPESGYKLEIVIEPKMAFGTGHHQTTWLMIREMFSIDLKEKRVLDMGCGTGILAIVAEKLGSNRVTAIDNDSWAYENALENIEANRCSKTNVLLGDASNLGSEMYDVILANINLNILKEDMSKYANCLNRGGILLISGILTSDFDSISQVLAANGLAITGKKSRNDWMMVSSQKI